MFWCDQACNEWLIGAVMLYIVFVVIEIVGPADDELAGKDSEGDDICGTFPPIVIGEEEADGGDNECGAKVTGFAQAVEGIDYFLL